jgi:hypothetical protein
MHALADAVRAAGQPKETDMYGQTVDLSTPESKARTLIDAATAARADAARLNEQADERRAEAAALDDKPGMVATAEQFRREATQLEQDAQERIGRALAYEEASIAAASERAGVGV